MKKNLISLLLLTVSLLAKGNSSMQVSDFMLDYNSLKETKVCVAGNITSMGNTTMLADRNNPMTSIFLDTSRLSRDSRKQIMQQCGIMETCSNVVCGKVSDIMYNKGLIVTEIR